MGALTIISDVGSAREIVAAPPHADSEARTGWLVAPREPAALARRQHLVGQLAAKLADMDVHRPFVPDPSRSPHCIEQLASGVDDAGVFGEMEKQVKLARGEQDWLVADRHLTSKWVDAY